MEAGSYLPTVFHTYFSVLHPFDVSLRNVQFLEYCTTKIGIMMKLIFENPYRILGLPTSASDREIAKRGDDLAMYIEMGMTKSFPNDYVFHTNLISRTKESLQLALSQLELGSQKIFHSSFWFNNSNSVDQLVFELLNEGELEKAEELWSRQIIEKVRDKNASTYRNFAILKILQLDENEEQYIDKFMGLAKSLFQGTVYSNNQDQLQVIGGDNNRLGKTDIQLFLMEEFQKHLLGELSDNLSGNVVKKFLNIFDSADETVKAKVIKKFTDEPIHRLELALNECQNQRKESSSNSKIAADKLFLTAKNHLPNLASILSKKDIHYQFISDKISKELLACSTAYFNWLTENDDDRNPYEISKKITENAKRLAVSEEVKKRVNDDLDTIEELKEQKKLESKTAYFIEKINNLPSLESLPPSQSHIIPNELKKFLESSIPLLMAVKSENINAFKEWSEVFVNVTLNYSMHYIENSNKPKVPEVLSLLRKVQDLYMDGELEETFNFIFNSLSKTTVQANSSSGGCYIATLVYGDYDSPEVLILRKFRDHVLARTIWGTLFIKIYYLTSPSLVKILKNRTFIQNRIRKILDSIVQRLSK
jgi:hypothetical protein